MPIRIETREHAIARQDTLKNTPKPIARGFESSADGDFAVYVYRLKIKKEYVFYENLVGQINFPLRPIRDIRVIKIKSG